MTRESLCLIVNLAMTVLIWLGIVLGLSALEMMPGGWLAILVYVFCGFISSLIVERITSKYTNTLIYKLWPPK
jgi:hypothetical protein